MKQKETAAVLMVLLAAACWGANGIFVNILTDLGFNGSQITLVRMCSVAVISAVLLAVKSPQDFKIDRRDLGWFAISGALGLYNTALKTIPASKASIAATFEPVAAALFGYVLFNQTMDGFGIAGIVCELAALVLLQMPARANQKEG